jgi:hypothetical protein
MEALRLTMALKVRRIWKWVDVELVIPAVASIPKWIVGVGRSILSPRLKNKRLMAECQDNQNVNSIARHR